MYNLYLIWFFEFDEFAHLASNLILLQSSAISASFFALVHPFTCFSNAIACLGLIKSQA